MTDNTNPALFAAGPTLDSDGTLTYTTAADGNGTATVTVVLMDDGGTANGGVDTSAPQSFEITVESINDAPSFNVPANHTSSEGCGRSECGGLRERDQRRSGGRIEPDRELHGDGQHQPGALSELPVLANDGALTYTAVADASGTATVTVELMDDGGTANGGVDTSAPQSFDVVVGAVNDAPSFNMQASHASSEDAGAQSVTGFASAISAGPDDESGQIVSFTVTDNSNPALFAAGPALDSTGTLTYTAAADGNGTATVTVELMDDGGTANGGVDTSAPQSFEVTVTAVNDAPSFSLTASHTSDQDAGGAERAGLRLRRPLWTRQ